MSRADHHIAGALARPGAGPSPGAGIPPAGVGSDPSDALLGLAAYHDLALQVARMASFDLDAATGVLSWSSSMADVLGCRPDDVESQLRRLLSPITATPGALRADFELDHRLDTPAGERFIEVRARSWPAGQRPHRVGLFGVISDVTERWRAEQDVVDLVDRYRQLVELSPDAIVVHEAGVVRYVNTAACRMAGQPAEAILGTDILRWMEPDDIDDLLHRLAGLTEPGMVVGPTLASLQDADGTVVKLEVVSVRTTWESRPAFQVIMRDVSARERAEAALRAQAQLVAAVSDAIVAFDNRGRVTSWNPAAERILGWRASEALGQRLAALADPFVVDGGEDVPARLGQDQHWSGELKVARADGSEVPVFASISVMSMELHGSDGAVVVLSDQSERHAAEAERRRAEARFSTVVAALDEGIAVLGFDGRVKSFNHAGQRILGIGAEEAGAALFRGEGLDPHDHGGRALAPASWPVQEVLTTGEGVHDRTVGVRHPDGRTVWLRMNAHLLPSPDAQAAVVCSFADITEERRAALELTHAATHDALTGLFNRAAMRTLLDAALSEAPAGRSTPVSVLFCDLDRFKEVNDSLGHPVGDEILCLVTERITALLPPGVSVGRLGGDEFIIVATDLTEQDALSLARKLVRSLCDPLIVRVHEAAMAVTIGASVGVAIAGEDTQLADSTEALRAADVALYRAKARGRNRVEVYDPSIADTARQRLETREDLRLAIETGTLDVYYQPLWRTSADPAACRLIGFEALARWNHPVRGPQSPAEFIPLAEETGLIDSLGAHVLRTACQQMARWRNEGHDLYVSVNLSARQLSDPYLVSVVKDALLSSGLPAEALWLELTETALADETVDAVGILRELAALGVRLSIDDFGTGYSSLGRLRHLPIAALKIDQSFVADMTAESAPDGRGDEGVIVGSTVDLAHRLGLLVVAEGVETPEQLAGLAALNCEVVQGFLLGRPQPAEKAVPGSVPV